MHGKDTRRILFSLRLRKKQILVRGERDANHLRRIVCELFVDGAAQVRSPVHTYVHLVREPFASSLRTIWRARVYEA